MRPVEGPQRWSQSELTLLSGVEPRLAAAELRRLAAQFGHPSWELHDGRRWHRNWRPPRHLRLEAGAAQPRVTTCATGSAPPGPVRADLCLHPALLRAPVDLDLVRHGRLGVDELHPLVRAALFPSAPPAPRDDAVIPPGFAEGERFRVRCGPDWHAIRVRGGRLELLHHTDDERLRERALHALGGAITGCFTVDAAWHDGAPAALPRRLHEHRRDLWRRMQHGGGRVVLALPRRGPGPGVPRRAGPDTSRTGCTSSSPPSRCPGCSTRAWT